MFKRKSKERKTPRNCAAAPERLMAEAADEAVCVFFLARPWYRGSLLDGMASRVKLSITGPPPRKVEKVGGRVRHARVGR